MSHSAPHSPQSAGPEPTSPGPGPDPGPSPDSTKVLEKPRLSGSSEAPADNTESSPEDLLGLVLCDSCIDTPLPAVKSCLTCLVSFCSSHLRPHLENPKFCSHRLLDPLQDVERRTCEIHHQSLDWFCVPDQECICEGCVEEAHRGHERRSVEEARRSVERELKQKEGEMAKTVTAAEAAINKLQQNMVSIESSVSDVRSVVDSQLDVLSAFVEQTKRSLMDLLEAEEKQALNQAHGIQVHLENRLLDLRKTQVQVQRISRTKNSLDFLQEYCEWRQQALDTSLPSVCIELKDTSKFFAKIITESTEKLCVAMTTEFTDRLHKACTHEPALGIKTTVQKINAAQRNKRLPDPQTRKDLLKYGKQLSFDGTSSHKFLRLTEEGRKVTNTTPWQHPYPDHDLRFDHWRQVLCTESVYLDRVYYELDFNGDGTHLGLAYKSLPRKGAEAEGCLCSNNGSWCLQWTGKSFSAWHDDEEVILPVTPGPRFSRMGVYVDHTGGLLRFYGLRPSPVDDDAQICLVHEFTAQFREPLYPAFFLPKKENAVMLVPPGEPVKSPTPPTSSNNNENANNNNGNANNNNEKTTSPLNGDSKTVTSETAQNVNAKNAKSEVAEEAKANSDGNANKWNANPTENRDSNTPTKETAPNANANNSSNAKSDIADIG